MYVNSIRKPWLLDDMCQLDLKTTGMAIRWYMPIRFENHGYIMASLDDMCQFDLKTMAIFRILNDMCQLDPKTMAIRWYVPTQFRKPLLSLESYY